MRRKYEKQWSINPNLKFTIELESDFIDKKLPTLDTNIWFSRPEAGAPIVQYEFFEKSMNSKFCILEKSAMAYESKLSILSNEVVRRLLNTSETVPQDRKDSILNDFVFKMLRSGYSVSQCRDILISGIRFYKAKVSRANQSGSKLHRSAQSSLVSRLKKKITAKTSWYKPRPKTDDCQSQAPGPNQENKNKKTTKKDKNSQNSKNPSDPLKTRSVLFVPRTAFSKLTKMLRDEERKLSGITGYKVKIQEVNGTQLRRILCRKNPFQGIKCQRPTCMVCKEHGKGDCRRRSVTYQTTCDTCRARNAAAGVENTPENVGAYWGESHRSAAERSEEHLHDMRAQKDDSHMWKHKLLEHPDEEVTFTMKVLKKHYSAFERYQVVCR